METAGQFGLNILLLWAGIVTLASASAASPALTTHASTVTKTNVTDSVAPQTSTQTQPGHSPNQSSTTSNAANQAMTSPTTTTTPTTRTLISTRPTLSDATRNDPTQPPQVSNCSYTLDPIQFGFRINIENFLSDQTYTLTLEDQTDGTTETYSVKSAVDNILGLKPCTNYRHNLSYCKQSGSGNVINPTAKTRPLESADFMNAERNKDKICYQSQWDINNSVFQIPPNTKSQFCITYDDSDICTNFMKNVPTNCNSSITLSKFIDLDLSDIKMTPADGYPKNFALPPNCKNWTVSHTCSEKGKPPENKFLSELEPYTDYRCTATATRENVTRTRDFDVRIDCKLRLDEIGNTIITNTSVDMKWKLSSSVCEDHLTRFRFSYECQCTGIQTGGRHDVNPLKASCHFSGLRVHTNYKCGINVKYNNETVSSSSHTFKTGPGSDTLKEEKNIIEEKEKNMAEVVLMDFSYTVKVIAFNGHVEIDSSVGSISTARHNGILLIRVLIFLILTFVALILVAYKISILRREKSRRRGRRTCQLPDED